MSAGKPKRASQPIPPLHIATIAHDGLLWDAYLDIEDDPGLGPGFRGRLRFNQAGGEAGRAATRTTVIIIEDSYEEAVAKARSLDDRQLKGLLRSALPSPGTR